MDDCMAAMVLMSLSCSPKSPIFPPDGVTFPGSWSSFDSGLTTNSTASRSNSPSPPVDAKSDGIEIHVQRNKSLKRVSSFDEGIDESLKFEEDFEDSGQHHRRVLFRCTWPGCSQLSNDCEDIERHVRVKHLGRSEDSLEDETSDHEEEFYYTEIEMHESDACPSPFSSSSLLTSHGIFPSSLPHSITTTAMPVGGQSPLQSPGPLVESDSLPFFGSSSAPTWSHLDMVRPPHEDPEYKKYLVTTEKPEKSKSNLASSESPKCLISHPINIPGISFAQHYARPLNLSSPKAANYNNANKYMRLNGNSKSGTTLLQSPSKLTTVSPTRRTRGETRKCRKQYGMENRDSWCTQCKWKKACSRFVD